MPSEIEQAMRQICEEKGISYEAVLETIESALAAAYRKDYGNKMQNLEAEFSAEDGSVNVFDVKEVVEDVSEEELEAMRAAQAEEAAQEEAKAAMPVPAPKGAVEEESEDDDAPKFNPKTQIMFSDAQVLKSGSEVGDIIRTELPVAGEFGRMAAMTAKQVIMQKLREAEREIIFNEYKEQEGEVLIGTVQRREGRVILVDIGRTTGVLLPEDQIQSERYNSGDRIKVYVREVSLGARGPQILLSRTSEQLVQTLFEIEIPEVADGSVEIKTIAREAGARSKVAVASADDGIDPIGACIGQRGIRIQTIIHELGGEKIDVIEWSDDPATFIESALAPAKVQAIELNEEENTAIAIVEADQLSLAIGRGGQNVRLAARLAGWRLSVQEDGAIAEAAEGEGGGDDEEETGDAEVEPVEGEEAPEEEKSDVGATQESPGEEDAPEEFHEKEDDAELEEEELEVAAGEDGESEDEE